MMSLRELQEQFQAYVLKGDQQIANRIVEPSNMTSQARLHVYRNAYYLRLIEVLAGDFSILEKIMGEAQFAAMAHDYLDAYPSQYFSVRSVGQHLSQFLKENEKCHPAYVELVDLEWALNLALFAKQVPTITMETLAKIPPDDWANLTFTVHPSVHFVSCVYNTAARWQSVNANQGDIAIERLEKPVWIFIYRSGFDASFITLEDSAYELLTAIQQGELFSDFCERMLQYFPEEAVVPYVANHLQQWVRQGIFTAATINLPSVQDDG